MAEETDQRGSGSTNKAYLAGAGIIFAVGLAVIVWMAAEVLLLLVAATLLAVFLRGATVWLSGHTPLSQRWALPVTVLGLTVVAAGVIWILAPQVANQVDRLAETLPPLVREHADALKKYEWGKWLVSEAPASSQLLGSMGRLLERVGLFFSSTIGVIVNFVLILVVGLFLAAEADRYQEGIIVLLPPASRARARDVLTALGFTIRGWLLGQLVSMTFLGVFAYIGLSLLGIPLALTLALLTALLTFIPNLGPILSVIPPALLALTVSPLKALYVLLFYIVLQNVEGNFVTPMVMRTAIRLPPALLIASQLILALLFGFFGLMLAAPLVAVALVLVKLLYLEGVLGERVKLAGYESGSAKT